MCIAIYKPKGAKVTKGALHTCWTRNSDGGGFMYVDGGQLIVHKGFFKFKPMWKEIHKHMEKDLVIHFRIATSGKIDYDNCHPFLINDGLAFVHNGIFDSLSGDAAKCDTLKMAEILGRLPNDFIYNDAIMEVIGLSSIGSKLVFMDYRNTVKIIHEQSGLWQDGVWYSNSSFKYPLYTATYYNGRPYSNDPTYREIEYNFRYKSVPKYYKNSAPQIEQLPPGFIDEYGKSAADYEEEAREEGEFWLQHPELLDDEAYMVLRDILAEQCEIRDMMNDWIETYNPDYSKLADEDELEEINSMPRD